MESLTFHEWLGKSTAGMTLNHGPRQIEYLLQRRAAFKGFVAKN